MDIVQALCQEFHLKTQQCENVLRLIDDGNTIPFIARYRKEQTGSLDDQLLREIYERLQYLRGLDKRRGEIAAALEEQGNLTDELSDGLQKACPSWRTSTVPSGPSAAPAPPSRGKRGWSRWRWPC